MCYALTDFEKQLHGISVYSVIESSNKDNEKAAINKILISQQCY